MICFDIHRKIATKKIHHRFLVPHKLYLIKKDNNASLRYEKKRIVHHKNISKTNDKSPRNVKEKISKHAEKKIYLEGRIKLSDFTIIKKVGNKISNPQFSMINIMIYHVKMKGNLKTTPLEILGRFNDLFF